MNKILESYFGKKEGVSGDIGTEYENISFIELKKNNLRKIFTLHVTSETILYHDGRL